VEGRHIADLYRLWTKAFNLKQRFLFSLSNQTKEYDCAAVILRSSYATLHIHDLHDLWPDA
jgi:hypothetical protein